MFNKKQNKKNTLDIYNKLSSMDSEKIHEDALKSMNKNYYNNESHKRIEKARENIKIK